MVALGGCVANDVSLSISRFIPPDPAGTSSGVCSLTPSVELNLTRGVWDLAMAKFVGGGYSVAFVVENNLPMIAGAPIETQAYYVNSFDILLEPEGQSANAIPAPRREFSFKSGSVRLAPGDSAAAFVEAIPSDLLGALTGLQDVTGIVSARIRAVATRAEEEVRTAYSSFPIQLCRGCLGNTDASGNLPPCLLPKETPVVPGNPCNVSQDSPVLCCDNGGVGILCGKNAVATQ